MKTYTQIWLAFAQNIGFCYYSGKN